LLFLKQTVNKEKDWNGRCETPVGVAGQMRPRRRQKVGMLLPRRPVVTHAWPTSCGPRLIARPTKKRASWSGNPHFSML